MQEQPGRAITITISINITTTNSTAAVFNYLVTDKISCIIYRLDEISLNGKSQVGRCLVALSRPILIKVTSQQGSSTAAATSENMGLWSGCKME